jgi:hypothetical protein
MKLDINKKYGRLTPVKSILERSHYGSIQWIFKCDCGKESIHIGNLVTSGRVRSCGCLRLNKDPVKSIFKEIFQDYKFHAKKRGYEFLLSFELFCDLIQRPCFYCNLPFSRIYNYYRRRCVGNFEQRENSSINLSLNSTLKLNGIDRRDNAKDYTIENSVPCCKFCNKAKYDLTEIEFIEWLNFVRNN